MDNEKLYALLCDSFPFFESLPESDKNTVMNSSVTVKFDKGINLHDGNECTGVILVRKGCLRLYMLSDEGKEITLYRIFKGEMCMLSASCVLDAITFDVFVDAEEDSECVVIGGCIFEELSRKNKDVKIFALETALGRFSDVMWVMQQILFMSMDKRLAIFLLDESGKSGSDTIKLTHEQIAKYMGSAREVVSRMLKYFAGESIIEMSRSLGVRILDKKRLRAISIS